MAGSLLHIGEIFYNTIQHKNNIHDYIFKHEKSHFQALKYRFHLLQVAKVAEYHVKNVLNPIIGMYIEYFDYQYILRKILHYKKYIWGLKHIKTFLNVFNIHKKHV